MRRAADVRSIEALKEAKAALTGFRETVGIALGEAHADVQRTIWWIQNEKKTYWMHEVKRRTEYVNLAKSELYRAQLAAMDPTASCLEQKKMLERAERGLEEAKRKVQMVTKWARVLDRELMLYKGKCQPIARAIEAELPRGEARLELLLDKLDKYVRTAAPHSGPTRRSAEPVEIDDPAPEATEP